MDVVSFLSRYQKALRNRVDDISLSITSGSASDWEDYKARVGEIQGLTYALDELQTLLKKANYDEDVMPYMGKEKTDGGVYIPDAAREKEARATTVAYVVKVGPLAYQDPNKFGDGCEPWCKEGDWVCIGRYAGSRFNIEGGEVRIINDDEVIATIIDPDDIKTYGV
jgi:co-chaperonin GroES (HSP10)